jgi:hypothetical protein
MPTTPLLVISCKGKPLALINTLVKCSGDLNSHVGPVNGCSGQGFGHWLKITTVPSNNGAWHQTSWLSLQVVVQVAFTYQYQLETQIVSI